MTCSTFPEEDTGCMSWTWFWLRFKFLAVLIYTICSDLGSCFDFVSLQVQEALCQPTFLSPPGEVGSIYTNFHGCDVWSISTPLLATATTLGVLALAFTTLRVWLRFRKRHLWWDDYWAIISQFFNLIFCVLVWFRDDDRGESSSSHNPPKNIKHIIS
jgi:hypothetical protein